MVSCYDKLRILNSVSHVLTLASLFELTRLLKLFPLGEEWMDPLDLSSRSPDQEDPRSELFVILFNRCTCLPEVCSPKLLYSETLFTRKQIGQIQNRLGRVRTLDIINLTSATQPVSPLFELDMGKHEDFRLGWILICLLVCERNAVTSERSSYSEDKLVSSVSRSGQGFLPPETWRRGNGRNVPRKGILKLDVVSRKPNLVFRERLGYRYLGWGAQWPLQEQILRPPIEEGGGGGMRGGKSKGKK